jgi:uncharacterized protein (TIGR00162 family)
MMWKIKSNSKKIQLNNPILIEGLPGIGNVGKVAVDFMIDELKAKKLCEFESHSYPHSVFVNEKNLIELPTIEIYYKQMRNRKNDLMFLSGDVQPVDSEACYEFSERVIDFLIEYNCKELVTLGGVALKQVPKKPKVYCTGNCPKTVKAYLKGTQITNKIYGEIGPIVGVSGLLLGLAKKRELPAVTLLAETYGHPMYLGVNGAREIIHVLNKKLGININLKSLDKEIKELEKELQQEETEINPAKSKRLKKIRSKLSNDMSYIG